MLHMCDDFSLHNKIHRVTSGEKNHNMEKSTRSNFPDEIILSLQLSLSLVARDKIEMQFQKSQFEGNYCWARCSFFIRKLKKMEKSRRCKHWI